MSVKFEFTLSDIDAENLMGFLNDAKVNALSNAVAFLAKGDEAGTDWFKRHADYVEELKQKVLAGNTRVED